VAGSSFLFPPDRTLPEHAEAHGVQVRLDAGPAAVAAMRHVQVPCQVYEKLGLNRFWSLSIAEFTGKNCWQYIPQR
jgi:hypothetical protein